MSKKELSEELFRYLEGKESQSPERTKIEALGQAAQKASAKHPPANTWVGIEQSLSAEPASLGSFFRALTQNPKLAAFALLVTGILVGAFFLLNGAPAPVTPLIELTEARSFGRGQTIVARGMRIEALGDATVSREPGSTEKIYLRSGSFAVSLQHAQLEKTTRFVFPGGSLEPLGTAFTVKITAQGSEVNLTEGRIRIIRYHSNTGKWQTSEVASPYSGLFDVKPVESVPEAVAEPEPEVIKPIVQKPRSRFSQYVGKSITLELKNGDRLTGTLRAVSGAKLRLLTASGELNVPEAQVQRVQNN